jgi:thiazole synthase
MATAILDARAMDEPLVIAGRALRSRLLVGTGKYRDNEEMVAAIEASGAEVVTVAVRRVDLDRTREEGVLFHLDPERFLLLPNTAGCYTAEDAVRYARLARAAGFTEWVKLEVIGDQETLLPDAEATVKAARELVADGFQVLAYTNDDLITALRLEDAGCAAVMPLASPIGSGLGLGESVQHPHHQGAPAGAGDRGRGRGHRVRRGGDDGAGGGRILMNTALAEAQEPVLMARAMALATEAGRLAFLAGRMPRRERAVPSSPRKGMLD